MTEHTGDDARAARPGQLDILENERRGALSQRQPAALAIERPASMRIERLQRVEPGVRDAAERVGADGERHLRTARAHGGRRLRDRERTRRARRRVRRPRAVHAERLRDRGGGRRERRSEEAGQAPPTVLAGVAAAVRFLALRHAADGGPDEHAGARARRRVEPGLAQRLLHGDQREPVGT